MTEEETALEIYKQKGECPGISCSIDNCFLRGNLKGKYGTCENNTKNYEHARRYIQRSMQRQVQGKKPEHMTTGKEQKEGEPGFRLHDTVCAIKSEEKRVGTILAKRTTSGSYLVYFPGWDGGHDGRTIPVSEMSKEFGIDLPQKESKECLWYSPESIKKVKTTRTPRLDRSSKNLTISDEVESIIDLEDDPYFEALELLGK